MRSRQPARPAHMDVSNTVDVTDSGAVADAVGAILQRRHPGYDFTALDTLFRDFTALYEGSFPGFRACEIKYHDAQHVLDVTLAMARLLDGHELAPEYVGPLGPDLALAGIAAALFHDSGYIRRTRDTRHRNGAAYTRSHVSRSERFLRDYLPGVGLQHMVGTCGRIVHFTGYERDTRRLAVADGTEQRLGALLGTADLIAQMADADYVRKCRDHLYEELEIGGMAGERGHTTHTGTIYRSPDHLLASTPDFIRKTIDQRLEGQFRGAHRCAATHFGGPNLYMTAIEDNRRRLQALLAASPSAVASVRC
jgi:hypothetical protein